MAETASSTLKVTVYIYIYIYAHNFKEKVNELLGGEAQRKNKHYVAEKYSVKLKCH